MDFKLSKFEDVYMKQKATFCARKAFSKDLNFFFTYYHVKISQDRDMSQDIFRTSGHFQDIFEDTDFSNKFFAG